MAAKVLHLRRRAPLAPGVRRTRRVLVGTTNRALPWESESDEASERTAVAASAAPAGLPSVSAANNSVPPLLAHVAIPRSLNWASAEARSLWRRQFLRRASHARFGFEHAVRDTSAVLATEPRSTYHADDRERFARDTQAIASEDRARRAAAAASRVSRLQLGNETVRGLVAESEARAAARDVGRLHAIAAQRARYHEANGTGRLFDQPLG